MASKDKSKINPAADNKDTSDRFDSAQRSIAPGQGRKFSIGGSSLDPRAEDGVEWIPSENVWSEEFLQHAAATFESNHKINRDN